VQQNEYPPLTSNHTGAKSSLSEGILFERRQLHARFATEDAREGLRAFLARRPPVFGHR